MTALDSFTPEVISYDIHHSLWNCLTFGEGFKEFSFLFFSVLPGKQAICMGVFKLVKKMSLRNKAGQVFEGTNSD